MKSANGLRQQRPGSALDIGQKAVRGVDASLPMLNESDARSSRERPWAVDLENMAMPSARRTH